MKNIWFILIFLFLFSDLHATTSSNKNYTEIYQKLKQVLDPQKPGYGPSDYGKFDIVDIPKAYAMFLSAELMEYKRSKGDYNLSMAVNAGNWLIKNRDLNNNNIVGWGVPVAWDAFGDKSINEQNTEYTIATGIVLNSLMDWIELAPITAPKEKINNIIKQAIEPYLNTHIFSNTGLFNYSLKIVDRKYNCFNAAIYMAGQMQRYSKFISNVNLKNRITKSVDKVMTTTLKYKKIDTKGGWYWSYSVEEKNTPNDLAHASYIIDGIMTYIENQGTLKDLFNKQAILKHLNYFSNTTGTNWYFYPSFFGGKQLAPRLYGLGMVLNIYSKYTKDRNKTLALLKYTQNYELHNNLYSRWQKEKIVITEYLIYLMYGIASSEFYKNKLDQNIYLHNDQRHLEKVKKIFEHSILAKKTTIPFSSLDKTTLKVLLDVETYHTELSFLKNTIILNKYEAVPVKVLITEENIIIIQRELLTNHLIVVKVNKKNKEASYKKIDTQKNIFSDFREAIIYNNNLILIVYESHKQQNSLLSLNIENNFHKELQLKLPSVENSAGKTYEVIPKIILLPSLNKKLYIIGGRLISEFNGKDIKKKNTLDDVSVFIEAIINKEGEVYALYRNKNNQSSIINLTTNINYYTTQKNEIIFNISYYKNSIHYRTVKSINDLTELFLFDFLGNKGSGTLYMGTNNIEGWMAWAQVYYLNGMLSFLELTKNDIGFFNVMEEYIPQIKTRLDLEIKLLLHQKKSNDGLKCRVFTVDRSLATFAVQSSRFAMLLHRYLKLFPNKSIEKEYQAMKEKIKNLNNHMEVLERGTSKLVTKKWNPNNAYYLKWPKGNKFYFDGLPVPYNHQNEWATFILKTIDDQNYINIANSIINLFIDNITQKKNKLPKNAIWPYWWAKAWDGWNELDNISVHKKNYIGDKANGWISFRTIDAIAILNLPNVNKKYINTIKNYITNGYLYPFASTPFIQLNSIPKLKRNVISEYIRFSSPWEFDNSVWSYFNFIKDRN